MINKNELMGKLDELTIACSEIKTRQYREKALNTVNVLRRMVVFITAEDKTIEKELRAGVCAAPVYVDDVDYSLECPAKLEKYKNISATLKRKISDCGLTYRTSNCLKQLKIFDVEDLVNKTEEELIKIKNFGAGSLNEVVDFLSDHNIGLSIPEVKNGR